jgi:RHS repeat-associated protein
VNFYRVYKVRATERIRERIRDNSFAFVAREDLNHDTTFGLPSTYDNAGNARTQEVGSESTPTVITYTHDLWNRLVKVQYTPNGGSAATRAEYTYNALNWRIMKRADTNPSVSTALDQERKMYYSANWQVLEERIDDDYINSAGVNRRFQYTWGLRYIDDIVLRRLDGTADGDFTDGSDKVYYHCTDVQFSTVAVSYDPYGRARHHRPADMTGEGAVDTPDLNVVSANYGSVPAPGDVDRDGDVDVDDYIAVTLGWGAGIASGQLSLTDNMIGWDGYVFNAEMDGDGMYTVRYRHYRPGLGRWLERDPTGYTDGYNIIEYVASSPVGTMDAFGLQSDPTTRPIGQVIRPQNVTSRLHWCWDAELQAKWDEVMSACKSAGISVDVGCRHSGKPGEGTTDIGSDWLLVTVTCWKGDYEFLDCDYIKQALLHELEHARQACRYGLGKRKIKDFLDDWGRFDNQICIELGGYCAEPRNQQHCRDGVPIGKPQAVNLCGQACASVADQDDLPAFQNCVSRCLAIYTTCIDGQCRP